MGYAPGRRKAKPSLSRFCGEEDRVLLGTCCTNGASGAKTAKVKVTIEMPEEDRQFARNGVTAAWE